MPYHDADFKVMRNEDARASGMNIKLKLSAAAFFVAIATQIAFGFGHEGHEAIGKLATQKLKDDAARGVPGASDALDRIKKILEDDDLGVGAVATWADYIRLKEWSNLVKTHFAPNIQAAEAYVKDIDRDFLATVRGTSAILRLIRLGTKRARREPIKMISFRASPNASQ